MCAHTGRRRLCWATDPGGSQTPMALRPTLRSPYLAWCGGRGAQRPREAARGAAGGRRAAGAACGADRCRGCREGPRGGGGTAAGRTPDQRARGLLAP